MNKAKSYRTTSKQRSEPSGPSESAATLPEKMARLIKEHGSLAVLLEAVTSSRRQLRPNLPELISKMADQSRDNHEEKCRGLSAMKKWHKDVALLDEVGRKVIVKRVVEKAKGTTLTLE